MLLKHTQSAYCEVYDKMVKERFRVMRRHCRSVRFDSQFRCVDAQKFVDFSNPSKPVDESNVGVELCIAEN